MDYVELTLDQWASMSIDDWASLPLESAVVGEPQAVIYDSPYHGAWLNLLEII